MKLTPLRILGIGWGVFLLYAYPGYVDTAAADMMLDARAHAFGDWGSPVMARITWLVNLVVGGPPGMLALQSLLALGGAYALARRAWSDRAAAVGACGVLLFPPVLAVQAVVCTASLFAGFALAGTALVTSTRARRKIGGLAMLLLACDLHPSAPFALAPLVICGLEWRPGMPRVRRYAIASIAFVAIVGGSILLEHSIVELRSYRKEATLARHDVKGIAHELGGADPRFAAWLALDIARDQHALIEARRELRAAHPGAYLAHRLRHLGQLLVAKSKLQTSFVEHPDHAEQLGYRARHSAIQRAAIAPVELLSRTPLFWPVLYLAGGIVVAVVARRRLVVMLVASGIAWELAAALFTTSAARKSSHWLVVAVTCAVVLALRRAASASR